MSLGSLFLGIDIGGTTTKLGVVDLDKRTIVDQRSFETPLDSVEHVIVRIGNEAEKFFERHPLERSIGVGAPGAVNLDRSLIRNPPNLPAWKEVPLKKLLEERISHTRIEIDNDAKIATLAEARWGAGEGLQDFVMLTLGTGVGGGLYMNGTIVRGASGGAGEFGQMSITSDGTPLERLIGQRFLTERALDELRNSNEESSLRSYLTSGTLDPKAIYDAAKSGDRFAKHVFHDAGELLGMCCANVTKLLDVYIYVIGGGVAKAGSYIFDSALATLHANVLPQQQPHVEIRPAALGANAGMFGAAILAAESQ